MSFMDSAKLRSCTGLLGTLALAVTLAGCGSPSEGTETANDRPQIAACEIPGKSFGFAASLSVADGDAGHPVSTHAKRLEAPESVEALMRRFADLDYDLARIHAEHAAVPRISVRALPPDLGDVPDVDERKTAFVATVLPLALQHNERIHAQRQRLLRIVDCLEAGGVPTPSERAWLQVLHAQYDAEGDLERLIRRVDVIPPSLLLAQAAIESGWGTSRFAKEGNALFGERTYNAEAGLVPAALGPDAGFRVRSFDALESSIEAYAYNLNVSPAYAEFRALRAAMHETGSPLDGAVLAIGLQAYSERGAAYVDDVRDIIRGNRLTAYDRAVLEDSRPQTQQAARQSPARKASEPSPS